MSKKLNFLAVSLLLLFTTALHAQITTSSMTGRVTDTQGTIVGATIVATHIPSGTTYGTITNVDGRFILNGMRVGGPYKVEISFVGYGKNIIDDIILSLGETYVLNVKMQEEMIELKEFVVSAEKTRFTTERTGATTNISNQQMNSMPTITRSVQDIARLSPFANGMSFAGSDGRSTNFTVDGANFNNNFGLSSNLPGGGNPISLDAIEEVQVVVAPFDVRQTNFIGGGINAITKSGTNEFKGTAYTYYKNQEMRGNRIDEIDFGIRNIESTKNLRNLVGRPYN